MIPLISTIQLTLAYASGSLVVAKRLYVALQNVALPSKKLTYTPLRISRRKPKPQYVEQKDHRRNNAIRVPEVRLIDETGQNHGVVTTSKALAMAYERGLDLVEVSPLAQPPVAKILDFSKLRYQEEKERRKERAKQKKVEVKGVRLSLRIGDHDLETRITQAEKFLSEGNRVRAELILRGRERRHTSLATEIIKEFVSKLNAIIPVQTEEDVSIQGGKLAIIVSKK